MSNEGWIKLHRKLLDNGLWKSEPFTRGQAWVDLLLLANHSDSFFYKRGVKVSISCGQIGRSEVEIADRWKWSRNKVRKFLNNLEKEQQIEQQKTNVTLIVTIKNYKEYQEKGQQTEHQKDSRKTPKGQQKDTYKNEENDKNDKNVKNGNTPLPPQGDENKKSDLYEYREYFELGKQIISFFPEKLHPKTDTDRRNWFETIRLLIQQDKLTSEEIVRITEWARNDSFWSSTFLSFVKMRRKKDGVPYWLSFQEKMNNQSTGGRKDNNEFSVLDPIEKL